MRWWPWDSGGSPRSARHPPQDALPPRKPPSSPVASTLMQLTCPYPGSGQGRGGRHVTGQPDSGESRDRERVRDWAPIHPRMRLSPRDCAVVPSNPMDPPYAAHKPRLLVSRGAAACLGHCLPVTNLRGAPLSCSRKQLCGECLLSFFHLNHFIVMLPLK